jgi:16S rRNA (guanine527-N7)-methyltransferase
MRGFDREKLMQVLNDGIDALDLPLWAAQREQLMDYLALMAKWNSVYNLTSLIAPVTV